MQDMSVADSVTQLLGGDDDLTNLTSTILGRILRDHRERNGWSRRELAERAEVSARFIFYVEAGTKSVTIRTLFRICDALGIRPSAIIRAMKSRGLD